MEYKYNSIYTKDNKDCMDISFLFKGKERDYVYIDNIENIKFEDIMILKIISLIKLLLNLILK